MMMVDVVVDGCFLIDFLFFVKKIIDFLFINKEK
jgi:hypothetical protein